MIGKQLQETQNICFTLFFFSKTVGLFCFLLKHNIYCLKHYNKMLLNSVLQPPQNNNNNNNPQPQMEGSFSPLLTVLDFGGSCFAQQFLQSFQNFVEQTHLHCRGFSLHCGLRWGITESRLLSEHRGHVHLVNQLSRINVKSEHSNRVIWGTKDLFQFTWSPLEQQMCSDLIYSLQHVKFKKPASYEMRIHSRLFLFYKSVK